MIFKSIAINRFSYFSTDSHAYCIISKSGNCTLASLLGIAYSFKKRNEKYENWMKFLLMSQIYQAGFSSCMVILGSVCAVLRRVTIVAEGYHQCSEGITLTTVKGVQDNEK